MFVSDLKPGQQFTLTAHFTATADADPGTDGIRLLDRDGKHALSARLDEVIAIGGGRQLPALSRDLTDEQVYQRDAARTMVTAAGDLRRVADRIAELASLLADGNVHRVSRFPNAGAVREALNEYRSATNAIMRIDSALESAMLADQARSAAEREG